MPSLFLLVNTVNLNQRQTLCTHNTNRHCRVSFYAFAGQPLSKQLYKRPVRIARPGDVDSSVSRVKRLTAPPVQGSLYSAGPCFSRTANSALTLKKSYAKLINACMSSDACEKKDVAKKK